VLRLNNKIYIRSITGTTEQEKLEEAMYIINDWLKGQKQFEFHKKFLDF
jgi:hypothetical protein